MLKQSKFVNILCSLLLGMVAGTFILFAIALFGGDIALNRTQLTLTTDSAEKLYDSSELTADGWQISGELKPGHTASVEVSGSRIHAGESENKAMLTITNEAGEDVTSEYKINYEFGLLKILPRSLIISSADASKTFDGEPLTAPEYTISNDCDGLLLGHKAQITVTGSIVDIGAVANTISSAVILDTQNNDVTSNYQLLLREGLLVVKDAFGNLPGSSISDNYVIYKVYGETSGYVYLKAQSYGDYNGTDWETAPVYAELLDDTHSAAYLTSCALNEAGRRAKRLRIQSFCGAYGLPYYLTIGSGGKQTNDTLFSGNTDEIYEVSYYDMVKDLSELYFPSQYETAYRQFVYSNYLSIDSESRAYMEELIQNEGFSASDPDIINAVAKYIQQSAVYVEDFDENLEKESNVAIAFLRDYKQGVCRHYASAAVLLYRALGIPARYTVGALAKTEENQWTDVLAKNAHAWVEVYVNNIGWVQVEVTGSAGDTNTVMLKPADVYYRYDGKEHTAPSVLSGFEAYALRGYTYKTKVSGSRTEPGVTETEIIELKIFNSMGKDVTDKFNIKLEKGFLQIYTNEIVLESESETVTYGSFSATPSIFMDDSGIDEMLTVITTRDTDVSVGINLNKFEVKILNENGEDVTERYKITRRYGELTVNPLQITMKAGDATKVYDGEALTCGEIELTEGALVKGHTLQSTEIVGSQKLVGRSENVITYVAIHDQNGRNVTENYAITLLPGTLKVTMR